MNVRICPVNMFICIFELVNVRVCPEIVWISQAEERKHQVTKFLKVRGSQGATVHGVPKSWTQLSYGSNREIVSVHFN